MKKIYHITSTAEVGEASKSTDYAPEAFGIDGFIHCSYLHQVSVVANSRFRGRTDLALFEIDPARLRCKVVDENLEGGAELFPHVYGRLPMSAVVKIHKFSCDSQGSFQIPDTIGPIGNGQVYLGH